MKKAVFLDRDGVLNKNVFYSSSGEWESPRTISDFVFIDGVFSALKKLQDNGYLLFIVTNQPSYAKGKTAMRDLQEILDFCKSELLKNEIVISKIYCSFSHPKSVIPELKDCRYRKPSPEAILEAAREFSIDLESSWMIGDRVTDVECGKSAGVRTIFVSPDYENYQTTCIGADFNVSSLTEAVVKILPI